MVSSTSQTSATPLDSLSEQDSRWIDFYTSSICDFDLVRLGKETHQSMTEVLRWLGQPHIQAVLGLFDKHAREGLERRITAARMTALNSLDYLLDRTTNLVEMRRGLALIARFIQPPRPTPGAPPAPRTRPPQSAPPPPRKSRARPFPPSAVPNSATPAVPPACSPSAQAHEPASRDRQPIQTAFPTPAPTPVPAANAAATHQPAFDRSTPDPKVLSHSRSIVDQPPTSSRASPTILNSS